MKKRIVCLALALLLLLCGCNEKGGNEDFTQRNLPAPDRMEVQTGTSTVEYLPESEEYQKIYSTFLTNWWKTTGDNKAETASDEALFMAESPEQLRFTSDRTYRESDDTFLYFYYETEPFTWVNPAGPDSELGAIAFLLPDRVESAENVRGCYMAMEGTDFSSLKGLFAYYYPPEVAASFWDFIRE